ncbi:MULTISPECIES: sulfatase-like hydrolase/transferase [unclassified Wenzhouxiangella]|uniref:sulfatase-like hydrolase/transferase n=1 Tax=unclassified Wenzhouxiangella TaxID=2613841 RepID=UPI0015F2AC79|nr:MULTISPECIES: sulfatase-like hydrolase/transferase [unclassified Wenzhouxiangella]
MTRVLPALMLTLAIVVPALLFVPIQIHGDNPYDFAAGLADLLPGMLGLAAVTGLFVFALLLAVPGRCFAVVMAMVLAFALLVWVHGHLLVWDYGVLDGSSIDWTGQTWRLSIDLLLWLTVPIIAVAVRHRLVPVAGWIALALILIQAVPAWQTWRQSPEVSDIHRYNLDDSRQFSFSTDRNVVVIVLDAFQSDIFQRIISDHEEWTERLQGFTYFRNALSGYAKTYPSITLMLSGHWYDNDRPLQEHVRDSFRSDSIPYRLRQQGWRVDLLPHIKRVVDVSPRVASNAVLAIACPTRLEETGRLADLGLFRVSPHWLKPFWLNDYQWRLAHRLPALCADGKGSAYHRTGDESRHAPLRFVARAQNEFRTDSSAPTFKLYHLLIPHAPFHYDEQLRVKRLPAGREGFERQSRAALEVVRRFLMQLEKHGIYDETLIAVVSDHGGGEYVDSVDLDALGADVSVGKRDEESEIPGNHVASGLPLVLIKPPNARGRLKISDAPVSLGDLARTLADLLELQDGPAGKNMFELSEDGERERIYRHFRFGGWSGEYLPEMTEYRVNGFGWRVENWQPTGRILAPAESGPASLRMPYRLGQPIGFRPGSPGAEYLGEGWSRPENNGQVWSHSRMAEIRIPLSAPVAGDLMLRLDFMPYTARGRISDPEVGIVVNGSVEHAWRGDARGWRELTIPADVARQAGSLHLELRFPDAASPAELGTGADARTLGIALYGLQITHAIEE